MNLLFELCITAIKFMCVVCVYICVTFLLWTNKWCILICNKPLEYSLLNPYSLRLIEICQLCFTMNIKLIVASLQYWYLVMVHYIFIKNKKFIILVFIHCEIYLVHCTRISRCIYRCFKIILKIMSQLVFSIVTISRKI